MPSTLVHVAIGGLVGAALLTDDLDYRVLAVVLGAAVVPDLDTFAGLVIVGAHRSLLHTLVLPTAIAAVLVYDTRTTSVGTWLASRYPRVRPGRLRERWGAHGVRLAWVGTASLLIGGILPDLFTNGVNVFYPFHDAFYTVNGELLLSNQRGIVQTFVEITPESDAPSTGERYYVTGVDPSAGETEPDTERIFPVVTAGWQLLVVLTSTCVLTIRLWESRRQD
jgi:hypothetical protein